MKIWQQMLGLQQHMLYLVMLTKHRQLGILLLFKCCQPGHKIVAPKSSLLLAVGCVQPG